MLIKRENHHKKVKLKMVHAGLSHGNVNKIHNAQHNSSSLLSPLFTKHHGLHDIKTTKKLSFNTGISKIKVLTKICVCGRILFYFTAF
jgi:hypothetical protein